MHLHRGRGLTVRRTGRRAGAVAFGVLALLGAGACSSTTTSTPTTTPAPGSTAPGGPNGPGGTSVATDGTTIPRAPGSTAVTDATFPDDPTGTVPVAAGSLAAAAAAKATELTNGGIVHRAVTDGELTFVHVEVAGPPPKAMVIAFTPTDDGGVTERARVVQDAVATTPGGHTMFDGGGNPAAATSPDELEANIALVRRLYDDVFVGKQAAAIDELVSPDYVQHSPLVGDGPDELRKLTANGLPVEVLEVIAQGDLVAANVEYAGVPAVDLFRIEDGRITEHWDVLGAG